MLTKVLVTGGNGFLGSNIVKTLSKKVYQVSTIIRTKSSAEVLSDTRVKIFRGNFYDTDLLKKALDGVDVVIHTAGLVDTTNKKQEDLLNINYRATKTLIDACITAGVKKFIYISSCSALTLCQDNFKNGKYTESSNFNLHKTDDWYAKSKALATNYVLHCGNSGLIDASVIYPTSIIGPNFAVPTATHKMLEVFMRRKFRVTLGGGYNFVDIRYVTDVVIKAIHNSQNGEGYIACGEFCSLKNVLKIVAEYLGKKPPKLYVPKFIIMAVAHFLSFFGLENELVNPSALKTVYSIADFDPDHTKQTLGLINTIPIKQTLFDTMDNLHPTDPLQEQLTML